METNERKSIKVFLTNGFKYEGVQIELNSHFLRFLDAKDHKEKTVPCSSISIIENGGIGQ